MDRQTDKVIKLPPIHP